VFGAYYYGFLEKADKDGYLKISYLAEKLDKNDFMHSNSPYSLLYVPPPRRGPVIVNSNSPPSPPMTLDSPVGSGDLVQREREAVGPHASTDPGLEGINEFGTNTFQMQTWMLSPSLNAAARTVPASTDAPTSAPPPDAPEIAQTPEAQPAAQTPEAEPVASTASTPAHAAREFTMDDGMETDTEFEREMKEGVNLLRQGTQDEGGGDEPMPDVGGGDDLEVMETPQVNPPVVPSDVIDLSDDEEIDHPHASDDDADEEDGVHRVVEMKPVIAPSGAIVKVEKDWWAMDAEKRRQRKIRENERKAKDQEIKDANKKIIELQMENKAKLKELETQNDAKIEHLSSQLEKLQGFFNALTTQAGKPLDLSAFVSQGSQLQTPVPPTNTALAPTTIPAQERVEQLDSQLPYPRHEDTGHAIPLAHDDVVAATPASQLLRATSPAEGAFAVVVPSAPIVPPETDPVEGAEDYHRLEDTAREQETPATGLEVATVSTTSRRRLVELDSPSFVEEEERVDYSEAEEDLYNNVPAEGEAGPSTAVAAREGDDTRAAASAQVQPSDPYGFE